jgi:hypothetical protein
MGFPLRNQTEDDDPLWRGPNDPPGTFFREEQTKKLYNYTPRPLPPREVARQFLSQISQISKKPVESQLSPCIPIKAAKDTFQSPEPNPRLALIEARRLVELASEFRSAYSDEQLRPYAIEVEAAARALVKDLRPENPLTTILRTFFPGSDE